MLSYQHIYHAGNAADVQKHLWLIEVIQHLQQQNRPITWLDTHAGRGLYDLSSKEAQKLGEYRSGFLKYRDKRQYQKELRDAEKTYLKLVDNLNKKRKGFYPGSALIAAQLLDKPHKINLFELHKGEIEHLKAATEKFTPVKVYKENGYDALLKVAQKKPYGGVIIDPSYEVKTEYQQVFDQVATALKTWSEGIFLIWYPLLPAGYHKDMVNQFNALPNIQIEECLFRSEDSGERGLYGTGMIAINAPQISYKDLLEELLK